MKDTLRDSESVRKSRDNLEKNKVNSCPSNKPSELPWILIALSIFSTILFIFLAIVVYNTVKNRNDDLQGVFAIGWTNFILLVVFGIVMSSTTAYLIKKRKISLLPEDRSISGDQQQRKKKINLYVKRISVGVFLVLILILIIYTIPKLNEIVAKVSFTGLSDGWIDFWGGIIGSSIGVIGAYLVMSRQIKIEKKHEKEMREPILSLGSINYTNLNVQSYKKGEYFIKNREKWELKIPVINAGMTPLLNVEMTYSFDENHLKELSRLSDTLKSEGGIVKGSNSVLHYSKKYKVYECQFNNSLTRFYPSKKTRRIPVIMPGKTELIGLPNSYSDLIIFYVRQKNKKIFTKKSDVKVKEPTIQVQLKYKDYLSNIKEVTFEIQFSHDSYFVNQKNISFTLIPVE